MPCIISAQKGLNDPRYPKLPDIMKAKSKPIEERNPTETESRTEVIKIEIPSKQRAGVILGAEDNDLNQLVKLLHEEAKVI
jgi:electron transfer flavoprotein beta subunit